MHWAVFITNIMIENATNQNMYFPVRENDIFLKNGKSDMYILTELHDTYEAYQRYIHDMHSAIKDIVPA